MMFFLTRAVILILGYAYPAFECFKIVERNRPEIEQLIFWCQYWIIIAAMTVLERVGDTFVSWLPMYNEAKLAFIVYLWHPKTKGTTYVYEAFVRPFVTKHETDIDRNLQELKTRAGDMVVIYGRRSSGYVQARFLELLHYVASQSSRAHPVQNVHKSRHAIPAAGTRQVIPAAGSRQAIPAAASRQPVPPGINHQPIPAAGTQPLQASVSDANQHAQPTTPDSIASAPPASTNGKEEEMEIDSAGAEKEESVPREQNTEQVLRVTRSRLRQTCTQS